ncbi:MAG: hypothetical protein ACKOXQ_08090 [Hydrogenophaga sp.]
MTSWIDLPAPDLPVPAAYRGVWQRTLLETPGGRDTSTQVHWLQTEGWHADLRVPAGADPATPEGRTALQGFYGLTRITPGRPGQPDVCTWHRHWDVQPPRSAPDAGAMVFQSPERVIETGVHGHYLEVWERLPGSTGPYAAQAAVDARGRPTGVMRFVAGRYAITVRPRPVPWPTDLRPDETLAEVLQRHPDAAPGLLDFGLVFSESPA